MQTSNDLADISLKKSVRLLQLTANKVENNTL